MRDATLTAADVARRTLEAVLAGTFYILPHENVLPGVEARMLHILQGRQPHRGALD